MVRKAGVHYRLEINGKNSEQTGSVTKDPEVNVHILEGIDNEYHSVFDYNPFYMLWGEKKHTSGAPRVEHVMKDSTSVTSITFVKGGGGNLGE